MARKPDDFQWPDCTDEQCELLDRIDFYGNNAWTTTGRTSEIMPDVLARCEAAGLPLERIKSLMIEVGYSKQAAVQLERWDNKRRTGRFGRRV